MIDALKGKKHSRIHVGNKKYIHSSGDELESVYIILVLSSILFTGGM
jgi:hypothetical protein